MYINVSFSCVRDSMEEPMTEDGSKEQLDREERKERMREKEKAFVKELRKSQGMSGVQPIGTDRIFRRYWLFNSMSGLFIEDDDSELYKLLQAKDNENEVSDSFLTHCYCLTFFYNFNQRPSLWECVWGVCEKKKIRRHPLNQNGLTDFNVVILILHENVRTVCRRS